MTKTGTRCVAAIAALCLAFTLGAFSPAAANGKPIQVPRDHATVQDAVAAASEGQTILVHGTTETGVVSVTTDGLTIRGLAGAMLNGEFRVVAADVNIENWEINPELDSPQRQQGIQFNGSSGGSLKNSVINGGTLRGVWLQNAGDVSVKNNRIVDARFDSIGTNGDNADAEIKNNHLAGNGGHAITTFSDTPGGDVTNNVYGGGHTTIAGGAGVLQWTYKNNRVG